MSICIVLNGFHRGHTCNLPDCPPILKLFRPRTVTVCECDPDDAYWSEHTTDENISEYRVAFRSIDGSMALYTVDGKPDAIMQGGWVVPTDDRKVFFKPQDLYLDCHDPRGWGNQ